MHDNDIGDTGTIAIAMALKDVPKLKTLAYAAVPPHRSGNARARAKPGLMRLAPPRPRLARISTWARLGCNSISVDGAVALAVALKDCPSLQTIEYAP